MMETLAMIMDHVAITYGFGAAVVLALVGLFVYVLAVIIMIEYAYQTMRDIRDAARRRRNLRRPGKADAPYGWGTATIDFHEGKEP